MGERKLSKAHQTSWRVLRMPYDKRGTYIARLFVCLEACLKQLGVTTETHIDLLRRLERTACFIHESMSVSSRNYHSVQHVFDVAEHLDHEDPISVIASLFHDCVYFHVDGGLSDLQYEKLRGVVTASPSSTTTTTTHMPVFTAHTTTPCGDDAFLCMVEKIFGYEPGQPVSHQNGLNEFLSAVICVREMQPFLSKPILAQLACCIEASIPFRGKDPETGKSCMQMLFDKLVMVNQEFQLGLSHQEMVKAVQRAADMGNSDVANFGTQDVLWFLYNTWSLLPESNQGLRRQYLYSVQQFQFAVFKMYGFFSFLDAERIFPYFQGVPEPLKLEQRVAHAERNLQVGRKYVGAKLLSLSVLSAFAELTGGDAPISLFMGDLPSRHSSSGSTASAAGQSGIEGSRNSNIDSFEERIVQDESNPYPEVDEQELLSNGKIDGDVYDILAKGRRAETNFDVKQSPMAAYLYSILGDEELHAILQELTFYPMTSDHAWALLRRLPRSAVTEISQHMAEVAISRTDLILEMMEQL